MSERLPASVTESVYGKTADGVEISCFTLVRGLLTVRILEYGAVIESVRYAVNGETYDLVQQLDSLDCYENDSAYVGATVGPVANRLKNAQYRVGENIVNVTTNEGEHQLHGGPSGFHQMVWKGRPHIDPRGPSVQLECIHHHGTDGYVGNLYVRATFTIDETDGLCVEYEAMADAIRPVSLTSHSYFKLPSVLHQSSSEGQRLQLFTDQFLAVDSEKIPTGAICTATDGDMYLTAPGSIQNRHLDTTFVYPQYTGEILPQAVLSSDLMRLTIASNQAAIQVYIAHESAQDAWVCLEPQGFTDAPNRDEFPSVFLVPNEIYRYKMRIGFEPNVAL